MKAGLADGFTELDLDRRLKEMKAGLAEGFTVLVQRASDAAKGHSTELGFDRRLQEMEIQANQRRASLAESATELEHIQRQIAKLKEEELRRLDERKRALA